MNGDLHGALHIHQYDGEGVNLDDIQYIHASEIVDLATNEIVSGDVLIHVGGFFTSLEDWEAHRTDGGDPSGGSTDPSGGDPEPVQPNCDYQEVLNTIDQLSILKNWADSGTYDQCCNLNEVHPASCITDDFLIWMFEQQAPTCPDLREWMVYNLSSRDFNFVEMGEDVDNNRPWMHMDVQMAMRRRWMECFPNFDELREGTTPDEVNADFIANLCAVGEQCNPVDPPADTCPYAEIDQYIDDQGYEFTGKLIKKWWKNNPEDKPWDCIIKRLYQTPGSHCEDTRNIVAYLLERHQQYWKGLDEYIATERPWMHEEAIMAFQTNWATCFPDFEQLKEGRAREETGGDWIITLVPAFP